MTWVSNNAISRLNALVDSENCDLLAVLSDTALKIAMKKQSQKLVDFFINNIGRLVDIALGTEPVEKPDIQAAALQVITWQIPSMKTALLTEESFLEHLNQYIASEETYSANSITAFSRLLQYILTTTACQVLDIYPERELLFERILKYVKYSSINNLLDFMTNDGRKSIITFLENSKVTDTLLSMISDDEFMNEKVFYFLSNVVSTIEVDSPLLTPFEDPQVIISILDRALNDNTSTHCSARIFQFLIELSGHCEYDEEEEDQDPTDPLYETVYRFIIHKIPDISQYIMKSDDFCADKSAATELILSVLSKPENIPQSFTELVTFLYNKMFEKPSHTFLHHSFLSSFDVLMKNIEFAKVFIEQENVRKKLIESYSQKETILASYWGVLYQLSIRIYERFSCDDLEWEYFYADVIITTKEKILAEYGGPLVSDNDIPNDDDLIFPIGKSQMQKKGPATIQTASIAFENDQEEYAEEDEEEDTNVTD